MQEYKKADHVTDDFMEEIFNGNLKKIKKFIEAGQNVNVKNGSHQTALHVVIASTKLSTLKTIAVIELLLSAKANINLANGKESSGDTPLHTAVRLWGGDLPLIKFLVSRGAKVFTENTQDLDGETPHNLSVGEVKGWFDSQEKIIERQLSVQQRFFRRVRLKPEKVQQVSELKEQYKQGYKAADNKEAINVTGKTGRRLVMAESTALQEMSSSYTKDGARDKLKTTMQQNGWHVGAEDQYGVSSGAEELIYKLDDKDDGRLEIKIRSQHTPAPGHIGNFYMVGDYSRPRRDSDAELGRYGRWKETNHPAVQNTGVLAAIYEVTSKNEKSESEKDKEQSLANLLLNCLKSGVPITTSRLKAHDLYTYKVQYPEDRRRVLKLLNRLSMLAGVKEIVRRMYGSKLELPLSIAYIKGLKLVAAGHLTMRQLFSSDALYGIPTAAGFFKPEVRTDAKAKLIALNALYAEKMDVDTPVTREDFHQLLLEGYGGASDSEGDEYLTSEGEEEDKIEKIGLAGIKR